MTLHEKRAIMHNIIEQWHESGQTQIDFAKAKGISLSKFRYWIHKVRAESGQEFIQLKGMIGENISIRYPNGVEVSMPAQTPVAYLKSLISY